MMPPRSTISVSSPTEPASSARTNAISCASKPFEMPGRALDVIGSIDAALSQDPHIRAQKLPASTPLANLTERCKTHAIFAPPETLSLTRSDLANALSLSTRHLHVALLMTPPGVAGYSR